MSQDPEFCTVTMAKIYEKQGQLPHAAQIYRLMLQTQPDRKDLQAALSAVEDPGPVPLRQPVLASRFSLWMELCWRYQRLSQLRRWPHRLSEPAGTKSD